MTKLQEILESKIEILSEKKTADEDVMTVTVNWAKSGAKTKNGRIYSEKILQREIERLQTSVKKGALIGTADHNLDGFSNIKNASHVITELCMDEDGLCWAEMRILPTSSGKNIQTLIKNGASVGVSQRGFGDVARDGTVSDSFSLQGIDIVANPSYEGGVLSLDNISESLDFEEKKEAPSEEAIQEILSHCFKSDIEAFGYNRGYETWLTENEDAYRALILTEYGVYPDTEAALKGMGKADKIEKTKSLTEIHHYTDSECYIEARIMGISPTMMADKLNKQEELKRVNLESDFSEKEAQGLIQEAIAAGKDLSDPKERKAFLEKMAENRSPGEPTLHERSLQIQEKLKAKGSEITLETIQAVLVFDDKKAEIKKQQKRIGEMIEREISQSGANPSREERKRIINRELRKANLPPILNEEE